MKQNINKKYSLVLIIFLVIVTIGLTYSFFANQGNVLFNTDVDVTSNTTDLLTFQIDNDIDFEVSQQDFVSGGNNKSGYTNARAILVPNNKTGNATMNYYMYLNIENNPIDYSSTNTNDLPELMLQLYDGNNELVTIDYLDEMVTVKGVTGYDITGYEGLIPLLDNQEIVATNNIQTTQEWKVVVTLINLDINQNDNTGKEISAEVIMQKDEYTPGGSLSGNLAVVLENEIKLDSSLMKEYRGEGYYHDENDKDTEHPFFTRPIYYWDGTTTTNQNEIKEKWNVVFAGSCWQIYRTTENGGIKLLYNGVPLIVEDTETGNKTYDCSDTRTNNNEGVGTRESVSFNGNYYYGDSYVYDKVNQYYYLESTNNNAILMSSSNGESLEGKYTCKSTTSDGTCTTLYYIDEYISGSNAYAISLVKSSYRDNLGLSAFNSSSYEFSGVGYMRIGNYGRSDTAINPIKYDNLLSKTVYTWSTSGSINSNAYYASTYDYGETTAGKYTLGSDVDTAANWRNTTECNNTYSCLIGKYSINSAGTSLSYVIYVSGNSIYYVNVDSGTSPSDVNYQYMLANSITDNNNGYYTFNNPVTVNRFDWHNSYSNYGNYYLCATPNGSTCSYDNTIFLSGSAATYYAGYYSSTSKMTIYSNIEKNGNNYTLSNPVTLYKYPVTNSANSWYSDYSNYLHYYMCNDGSSSCSYENVLYIVNPDRYNFQHFPNYIFGRNISYNSSTGLYTIEDDQYTDYFIDFGVASNYNYSQIYDSHYTCLSSSNTCSTIYFVYNAGRYGNNLEVKKITLTGGKYVSADTTSTTGMTKWADNNNIIYEMYYSNVANTNNSAIKDKIDWWYKASKIYQYTPYIDDEEIYCNNRNITSFSTFSQDNNNLNAGIGFGNYSNMTGNINCTKKVDSFSATETTLGNGDLDYPIALPTASELYNFTESTNQTIFRKGSSGMNTMTPAGINIWIYTSTTNTNGGLITDTVGSNYGIRPVIALKEESLEFIQGDGSTTNPYIISVGNSIISNDINYKASKKKAVQGEIITITNNKYIVGSFKLNGTTVIGNTFIMPDEDVTITDIKVYKIRNNSNNNVVIPNSAIPGSTIKIKTIDQNYKIQSFKLNGVLVNDNNFVMPQDSVVITDIVIENALTILRNNPSYNVINYLEFTGTQYINTGIIPSNHTTEISFEYAQGYTSLMFGTNNGYYYYNLGIDSGNNTYFLGRNGSYDWLGTLVEGDHIIVYNDQLNRVLLDNAVLDSGYTYSASTDLWIGHRSTNGGDNKYLIGKIYYVKITDKSTDELVRWLVPVVRNSDNVAGMYDVVNDIFYTNAGTGTFGVPS